MVRVLEVGAHHLRLRRLRATSATRTAARAFGEALARTHAAGAEAFGAPPGGWRGDGFLGPLAEPLPLMLRPTSGWGGFWAEQRLMPLARLALDRGALTGDDVALVQGVAGRCAQGDFDTGEGASRIHGDLWSGNVMWTPDGAVLIDPAAHGGHREADLAMMALFGFPYLDEVVTAYEGVAPLSDGWRERVALHQLHPLLLHAAVFGAGYAPQVRAAARQYA